MIEEKLKEELESVKSDKNRIIPLSSDIIFKNVFKRCESALITMIKDIFELDEYNGKPITVIGYETISPKKDGKTYRSDLLITLSDKSRVLVEMNNCNDEEVIDRNLVQLVRIHSDILPKGLEDIKLKEYRLKGINFNNFSNVTGQPIESYAFCNIKTGKIITMMYNFCNVDIEKCYNLVYDIGIDKLPKAVRWGAILKEENLGKISDILGDDMLTMEEKEEFLDTINVVNNDDGILDDWFLDELAKHKARCQRDYAKKEGRVEGIEDTKVELVKNMLIKKYTYDDIYELTGKTIDEIKAIESNME